MGALVVAIVTSVALLCPVASAAAHLTVTTTTDELAAHDGRCSLREAIEATEAPGARTDCGRVSRGSNTIVLGSGRYVLSMPPTRVDDNTSGDLNVDGAPLTITGAGPARHGDRCRPARGQSAVGGERRAPRAEPPDHHRRKRTGRIGAGRAASRAPAASRGGAGADGHDAGPHGSGGGIFNAGTLVLDKVAVRGNTAGAGGAGGSGAGTSCNGGDGGLGGRGGGVDNRGRLTLVDSTVSGNRAGAGGRGGSGDANPLRASGAGGHGGAGGSGGGIDNQGTLSVTASTVAGNRAGAGGVGGSGRYRRGTARRRRQRRRGRLGGAPSSVEPDC